MKHFLSALLVLTLFISCSSPEQEPVTVDPPKDYTVENEKEITDYIAKHNLTAQKTASGLYYVINEPGTGDQPTMTSNVTVAYKGYYSNGAVFNESTAAGLTFNLQGVIRGWTEGIPFFKTGGSGILLIPSRLGYGSYDDRGIPGGSVLIFDVKLLAVK